MKHLFRIVLSAAVVATMTLACKKEQPEPKKDTTFVLEATVSGEAKYDGSGDLSYTVKSIKKIDEKEEFMPWTMEFSMDGGSTWSSSKPDFITLTTQENNGDLTAKTYTATFAAQEKTLQTSDIILKVKPVLSNVDLSKVDIKGNALASKNTANCYVIHNPGTYKFPTVYGNSIKNGATNTKAYTSTKTGPNILTKFLKADGTEITKPQIDGIANACLIWQDTKDLISEIKYENNYVSFAVKKETIHNGNAIIAVRNASNEILWSWHIWVTERDLSSVEVENFQHKTYKFLPVNLGWCGFGNEWYAPREVMTRLKQAGGKVVGLNFKQSETVLDSDYDLKNGNNPYYQWGRKDPMLPGDGITEGDGKDKTCYTTDDRYQFAYQDHGEPLNTTDIKEYIRNPHKFNIKWEMDGKYYNLWNIDNEKTDENDDKVVKTIYDPSPVGYTVPPVRTFTGFTQTGNYTSNPAEYNVKGNFDKGWHFYLKPNKQGDTVFFPACGYRYYSTGSLRDVTTSSYCWVAGPDNRSSGRDLGFGSDSVVPLDDAGRSYGFTVRPAQEK